jgi:hypothetical protein
MVDEEQFRNRTQESEDRSSPETDREAQRAEAEAIRERGTLTPEANKQGVTSHLPAEETEHMYRSEDESDRGNKAEELRKSA